MQLAPIAPSLTAHVAQLLACGLTLTQADALAERLARYPHSNRAEADVAAPTPSNLPRTERP